MNTAREMILSGALAVLICTTGCEHRDPQEAAGKLRDAIEKLDPTGAGRAALCEKLVEPAE
jgi:hypothetical protein